MKNIAIVALILLAGCGMTPKQWAYVGAGVLVTGIVASRDLSNGNHQRDRMVTTQPVNCQVTSCQ